MENKNKIQNKNPWDKFPNRLENTNLIQRCVDSKINIHFELAMITVN